jgi:hypothetical protein
MTNPRLDPGTGTRIENPAGIEVSDAEVKELNLKPDRFHGEWNDRVAPTKNPGRT